MRGRQYIVFAVIFGMSIISGALLDARYVKEIRDQINQAGRDGNPIIASSTMDVWSRGGLYITSPSRQSVSLGSLEYLYTSTIGFGLDGTFFTTSSDYMSGDLKTHLYRLPARSPASTLRTPTSYKTPAMLRSYGFQTGNLHASLYSFETVELYDLLTSENRTIDTGEYSPWKKNDEAARLNWIFGISPDQKALCTTGFEYGSTDHEVLWSYDVEEDTWSRLGKFDIVDNSQLVCGPNGDIIAFVLNPAPTATSGGASNPYTGGVFYPGMTSDIVFVDGHTGTILQTVTNASNPRIGERWASVQSGGFYYGGGGNSEVWLYDLENSWQKEVVSIPGIIQNYAIYEPPPNGLNGMYENYSPD